MNIILKDEIPIYQQLRRLAHVERDKVNNQIDNWLHSDIIKANISEYASRITLIKKKEMRTHDYV